MIEFSTPTHQTCPGKVWYRRSYLFNERSKSCFSRINSINGQELPWVSRGFFTPYLLLIGVSLVLQISMKKINCDYMKNIILVVSVNYLCRYSFSRNVFSDFSLHDLSFQFFSFSGIILSDYILLGNCFFRPGPFSRSQVISFHIFSFSGNRV